VLLPEKKFQVLGKVEQFLRLLQNLVHRNTPLFSLTELLFILGKRKYLLHVLKVPDVLLDSMWIKRE